MAVNYDNATQWLAKLFKSGKKLTEVEALLDNWVLEWNAANPTLQVSTPDVINAYQQNYGLNAEAYTPEQQAEVKKLLDPNRALPQTKTQEQVTSNNLQTAQVAAARSRAVELGLDPGTLDLTDPKVQQDLADQVAAAKTDSSENYTQAEKDAAAAAANQYTGSGENVLGEPGTPADPDAALPDPVVTDDGQAADLNGWTDAQLDETSNGNASLRDALQTSVPYDRWASAGDIEAQLAFLNAGGDLGTKDTLAQINEQDMNKRIGKYDGVYMTAQQAQDLNHQDWEAGADKLKKKFLITAGVMTAAFTGAHLLGLGVTATTAEALAGWEALAIEEAAAGTWTTAELASFGVGGATLAAAEEAVAGAAGAGAAGDGAAGDGGVGDLLGGLLGGDGTFMGGTVPEWMQGLLASYGIYDSLTNEPPSIDPNQFTDAAEAEAAADAENLANQSFANHPNQNTPLGSSEWTVGQVVDPETGEMRNQWTQDVNLSPAQEDLLEGGQMLQAGQQGLEGNLTDNAKNALGDPADYSGLPDAATTPGTQPIGLGDLNPLTDTLDFTGAHEVTDPTELRSRVEDAWYNKATSRLDPRFEERRLAKDIELRNQGLRPGTAAYDRAMGNLGREETDAYDTALNSSIMGGGLEADRQFGQDMDLRKQDIGEVIDKGTFANKAVAQDLVQQLGLGQYNFGQDMDTAEFQNSLRTMLMNEINKMRMQPLNELNQARSGTVATDVNAPAFPMTGIAQSPDLTGAAISGSNAEIGNQNAQQLNNESIMAGLNQLIGLLS